MLNGMFVESGDSGSPQAKKALYMARTTFASLKSGSFMAVWTKKPRRRSFDRDEVVDGLSVCAKVCAYEACKGVSVRLPFVASVPSGSTWSQMCVFPANSLESMYGQSLNIYIYIH